MILKSFGGNWIKRGWLRHQVIVHDAQESQTPLSRHPLFRVIHSTHPGPSKSARLVFVRLSSPTFVEAEQRRWQSLVCSLWEQNQVFQHGAETSLSSAEINQVFDLAPKLVFHSESRTQLQLVLFFKFSIGSLDLQSWLAVLTPTVSLNWLILVCFWKWATKFSTWFLIWFVFRNEKPHSWRGFQLNSWLFENNWVSNLVPNSFFSFLQKTNKVVLGSRSHLGENRLIWVTRAEFRRVKASGINCCWKNDGSFFFQDFLP